MGKTQQNVADELFLTRQSLSNWENGENFPDIPTLIELSNYYGFSLDTIKGDEYLIKQVKKDYEYLIKQVKKDYELINFKKANKKYSLTLTILLVIIMLMAISMSIFRFSTPVTKFLTIILLILSSVLILLSYKFLKFVYKDYKGDKNAPLWVSKAFGYGISINPYHKSGKYILIVLIIIIFTLFGWTIYSM
ncbi:helix-turn-helix transcriptional regulator [Lactococcus lactis]|uniref:helix-turn-helix transcriptional regulator n=1 Tax=Lactococcus lactis TaxID=1358 RepID=UPI0032E4C837